MIAVKRNNLNTCILYPQYLNEGQISIKTTYNNILKYYNLQRNLTITLINIISYSNNMFRPHTYIILV